MPRISHAGLTDPGRVRPNNEDRWCADPRLGLFIVSDGMGGHQAGEEASRMVVELLPKLLGQALTRDADLTSPATEEALRSAIVETNRQVRLQSKEPGLRGMGATLVLALIRDRQALIAHLGDSRAYRLRAGRLERLTPDHTLVQILLDTGDITAEQAARHPARNQLLKFVGMDGDALPDVRRLDLHPGDRLVLCSDGLSGMIEENHLRDVLNQQGKPASICQRLVAAANRAGGKDNVTALVLFVAAGRE